MRPEPGLCSQASLGTLATTAMERGWGHHTDRFRDGTLVLGTGLHEACGPSPALWEEQGESRGALGQSFRA